MVGDGSHLVTIPLRGVKRAGYLLGVVALVGVALALSLGGRASAASCDEFLGGRAVASPPPDGTKTPEATANQLLGQACGLARAGFRDEAVKKTQAAIEARPEVSVPIELLQLAELERIRKLMAAGNGAAAREALLCTLPTTAVATTPIRDACPTASGVVMEQPPPDLAPLLDPYLEARGLYELGRRDDAVEAAKKVVGRFPDAPVPPELKEELGAPDRWYRRLARWATPLLDGLLALLKVAAVALLAGLVSAAVVLRLLPPKARHALEFVPVLGWFLHPRVAVEALDVDGSSHLSGAALAARVEGRLANPHGVSSVEMSKGDPLSGLLTSLRELTPAYAGLATLVTWLLPGRTITFNGYLNFSPDDGVPESITAALADPGGSLRRTATFKVDPETPPEDRAVILAEVAADWIAHCVDPSSATSPNFDSHREVLQGVRQESLGRPDRAIDHYRAAVRLDSQNDAAELNLHGRPLEPGGQFDAVQLRKLCQEIERRAQADKLFRDSSWDYPIWYQVRYLLIIAEINAWTRGAEP